MATIEAQSLQLFAVNSTASEENSTQGPRLSRTTIRATGRSRGGKHYSVHDTHGTHYGAHFEQMGEALWCTTHFE